MNAEADKLVQTECYACDQTRKGYRAGHYERLFSTQSGEGTLKVPKLKGLTLSLLLFSAIKDVNALQKKPWSKCILPVFLCAVLKVLQRFSGDRRFQPEPLAI